MRSRYTHIIVVVLTILIAAPVYGQRRKDKGQTPKQAAKEQRDLQKARANKIDGELEARAKKHQDIQDKKTRRRMKRNMKKSQRLSDRRPEPFYKRWFRRKRHKKKR